MTTPRIISRSRRFAEVMLPRHGTEWGVISIGSRSSQRPSGFDEALPHHFRIEFDDIGHLGFNTIGYDPPTEADVSRIIDASEVFKDRKMLLCHCEAGVSRSTATAFMLRCMWEQGSEMDAMRKVITDRPQAAPNRLIVHYADEILNKDGRMVEALESVSDLKDRLGLK